MLNASALPNDLSDLQEFTLQHKFVVLNGISVLSGFAVLDLSAVGADGKEHTHAVRNLRSKPKKRNTGEKQKVAKIRQNGRDA